MIGHIVRTTRLAKAWPLWSLRGLAKDARERAVTVIKLGCLIHVVRNYCVEITVCFGPSMLPTFNARGDILLLEHFSVWTEQIHVGDVVVARSVQNPRHIVCKRVLGLPGDQVAVAGPTYLGASRTVTVPHGHVWLQGDNLLNSTDSRHYGSVPYNMLKGKACVKLWPLREAGAKGLPATLTHGGLLLWESKRSSSDSTGGCYPNLLWPTESVLDSSLDLAARMSARSLLESATGESAEAPAPSSAVCTGASAIFLKPKVSRQDGSRARLDVCTSWSTDPTSPSIRTSMNCNGGRTAADAFCKEQGFSLAGYILQDTSVGVSTVSLFSRQTCQGPLCRGFASIECIACGITSPTLLPGVQKAGDEGIQTGGGGSGTAAMSGSGTGSASTSTSTSAASGSSSSSEQPQPSSGQSQPQPSGSQSQPQPHPAGPPAILCINDGYGNIGCGNVGNNNRGDNNRGDYNIGNGNQGSRNIGSDNRGDNNVGSDNEGSNNIGSGNHGEDNIGSYNYGNTNIGSYNDGHQNIGSYNRGNRNIGSWNNGDENIGSFNDGFYNIGSFNRGDRNIGSFDTGDYNLGSFNEGSNNTGSFLEGSNLGGGFPAQLRPGAAQSPSSAQPQGTAGTPSASPTPTAQPPATASQGAAGSTPNAGPSVAP
ncbi:hypothetical protein WJX72_008940 [[Myrmecia] bisecta]|uniref:Peptidase S26 domain-containing protein n=1 Tax=[Myrmecia] bisecta TaxID=41462 RepID=A0AAW1R887_9CHLO